MLSTPITSAELRCPSCMPHTAMRSAVSGEQHAESMVVAKPPDTELQCDLAAVHGGRLERRLDTVAHEHLIDLAAQIPAVHRQCAPADSHRQIDGGQGQTAPPDSVRTATSEPPPSPRALPYRLLVDHHCRAVRHAAGIMPRLDLRINPAEAGPRLCYGEAAEGGRSEAGPPAGQRRRWVSLSFR